MKSVRIRPVALFAGLSLAAGLVQAGEVRVMCYQDGVECEVIADQAKRFEAQNPGTKIIIDTVPYKTIVEQLPVQLAAGQGPDIARVTDLGGLSKYYLDISGDLKDRKYWDTNFGATAPLAAPRSRRQGHLRFHVAADHDRPVREQDLVRAGQGGAAWPQGQLGRVDGRHAQGGQSHADQGRRGLGSLRPPLRRSGH